MAEGNVKGIEVETTQAAEEHIAVQKTGLEDLPDPIEVPPGAAAHFPQHAPRLYAGGQATLKAMRGK